MADVEAVERRIRELQDKIEPIRLEIQALQRLAQALRAFERGESLAIPRLEDLSELTMPRAAEQILREHAGEALHFRQITEIALKRGFRGKRTKLDAPLAQTSDSFRRMMAQEHDKFENLGKGLFRLKAKLEENLG